MNKYRVQILYRGKLGGFYPVAPLCEETPQQSYYIRSTINPPYYPTINPPYYPPIHRGYIYRGNLISIYGPNHLAARSLQGIPCMDVGCIIDPGNTLVLKQLGGRGTLHLADLAGYRGRTNPTNNAKNSRNSQDSLEPTPRTTSAIYRKIAEMGIRALERKENMA